MVIGLLVLALGGCGLTLDFDPPAEDDRADAAFADSSPEDGAPGGRRDGGSRLDAAARDGEASTDGPMRSDAGVSDGGVFLDVLVPFDATAIDGFICAGYPCGADCCDPRSFEVCCPSGTGEPYCAGMCI